MGSTPDQFVEAYVATMAGTAMDISRLVTEPSGLDAAGMIAAIGNPKLGRLGIPLMADFMAPEGSIYFDAIFGAYYGQASIRGWLVPAMAEIEFVEFVPMAEPVLFDDGLGGTSLDEWQMVANIGEEKIPLSRGVSVRRHRDGWITWACDCYDTAAFRQPPPQDSGIEAAPLPPWPRVEWTTDTSVVPTPLSEAARQWIKTRPAARAGSPGTSAGGASAGGANVEGQPSGLTHHEMLAVLDDPAAGVDFHLMSDLFHPTDSVYHDPIFGEFHGQAAIRNWITDVMSKVGNVAFEPLGPVLFDGTTSVQEWQQMAVLPGGSRSMMLRGTSVRRFSGGWLVYAADYFDTAPLADPEIVAASQAAGSTITAADVLRHRSS